MKAYKLKWKYCPQGDIETGQIYKSKKFLKTFFADNIKRKEVEIIGVEVPDDAAFE